MKVNGKLVDGPNEILLVLPRGNGNLVFKFRAVNDSDPFEKLCPIPTPPKVRKPNNVIELNHRDPIYLKQVDDYASNQTHWTFLESISATDGLEWTTVKLDEPHTWKNWRSDLEKAGFSIGEMNLLWQHFVKANNLSATMIEEARNSFLASEQERESIGSSSSSMDEAMNTLSGEPANVSVLDQRVSETAGKI